MEQNEKKNKYVIVINDEYMRMLYVQRCADTDEQKAELFQKVIGTIKDWLRNDSEEPLIAYEFIAPDGRKYQSWRVENITDGTVLPVIVKEDCDGKVIGVEMLGDKETESKFKKGDRVRVCKESGEKVPVFFGKKTNVSYIGKTGTVTGTETAKDGSTHVFVEMDEKDETAFAYLAKDFKEEELEKE